MRRARIPAHRRALSSAAIAVALSLVVVDVAAAVEAPPVAPSSATPVEVRHQVRKGETLSLIARRNGVTVSALVAANGITNVNRIVVGQWLVIPTASGPAPALVTTPKPSELVPVPVAVAPVPEVMPGATPGAGELSYVLRRGDSLFTVARRFKVTVAVLAATNRIANPNRVLAGTRLVIPSPAVPSPAGMSAAPPTTIASLPAPDPSITVAPTAASPSAAVPAGSLSAAAMAPWLSADQLARLPQGLHTYPERLALLPSFDRWAAENGIAPDLLKALAWMESGWQQTVVSSSGAIGVGQLLPATAAWVAGFLIRAPLDPFVADDNVRMSARFLAHLLTLTNGDVNLAVAGYYQGLTSIRRSGMKATTAAYVNVVLALRARF
jgi:soluble lytic murein transglycosylase-like protein